jgi:hypothetical protein
MNHDYCRHTENQIEFKGRNSKKIKRKKKGKGDRLKAWKTG